MALKKLLAVVSVVGLAVSGCGGPEIPKFTANMDDVKTIRSAIQSDQPMSSGGGAVAADPTGFANLTGTFKINGSPPSRPPLRVDRDVTVCAPGGAAVLAETIVVDPQSNGIRDILVYLDNVPRGSTSWIHPDFAATADSVLEGPNGFDQKNCIFLSHVFAMRSTQKVAIINSDPVGHNTNIAPSKGAQPSNINMPSNSQVMYTPGGESPAPFPVSCSIHPWMSAWMISRDNPYFAVSGEDGSFEITNAPAGVELEFRIWQETTKLIDGTISVNGQPTKVSKGKFAITLQPDQPQHLDFVMDAALFQ